MTTPANAIRYELWKLMDDQIKTFEQPSPMTPSELSDFSHRAEKIKQLGRELDQIDRTAMLEKLFGSAA